MSSPTPQALHTQLLSTPANPQQHSPLFTLLPAELRFEIFTHALTDFPDPSPTTQYSTDSYYTRLSYFSPRRSDLRLLRACRAIYREAWFLPFLLREQTHWLTEGDRAPPEYDGPHSEATSAIAEAIAKQLGGVDRVEIRSMRVFAQMWALEGDGLREVLEVACGSDSGRLAPRCLTVTVRHADWWWWEYNEPLRFEGTWISELEECLPGSVREVHVELESVERKKNQVGEVARQMGERWYFKREDGVVLFPDVTGKAVKVDRWSGSSTWGGETWTRDESAPGRVDYYIVTVVFRPRQVVERLGGLVNPETAVAAEEGGFRDVGRMRLKYVPEPGSAEEGTFNVSRENSSGSEEEASEEDHQHGEESDEETSEED